MCSDVIQLREIETDMLTVPLTIRNMARASLNVKGAIYMILNIRIAYSDMFLDTGNIRKSMRLKRLFTMVGHDSSPIFANGGS